MKVLRMFKTVYQTCIHVVFGMLLVTIQQFSLFQVKGWTPKVLWTAALGFLAFLE